MVTTMVAMEAKYVTKVVTMSGGCYDTGNYNSILLYLKRRHIYMYVSLSLFIDTTPDFQPNCQKMTRRYQCHLNGIAPNKFFVLKYKLGWRKLVDRKPFMNEK